MVVPDRVPPGEHRLCGRYREPLALSLRGRDVTGSYAPLLFFLLAGGLCFLVVQSGVRSGLERLCNILMPVLFVMLALLVVTALSLPGAGRGVAFYLTPDFSRLADPRVWTAAGRRCHVQGVRERDPAAP